MSAHHHHHHDEHHHEHSHDEHEHHHHHHIDPSQLQGKFIWGIVLNIIFVAVEAGAGFYYQSMALLSDAGHNLSDVASLLIALLAFRLTQIKPNDQYTYGYRKTTILAALINSMLLMMAMGILLWKSVERMFVPTEVLGTAMAIVAAVGIVINSLTALLFFKSKDHDVNAHGAYLHMAMDALVSLGVVISGLLIWQTNWFWLDGAVSIGVILLIFASTWRLLRESVRLSLDGVPPRIKLHDIEHQIGHIKGIKAIHHVHIWALSSSENAMTAHLVVAADSTHEQIAHIKHEVRHILEHAKIQHVTLEVEYEGDICTHEHC